MEKRRQSERKLKVLEAQIAALQADMAAEEASGSDSPHRRHSARHGDSEIESQWRRGDRQTPRCCLQCQETMYIQENGHE